MRRLVTYSVAALLTVVSVTAIISKGLPRASARAVPQTGPLHVLNIPYYTTKENWESLLRLNNALGESLRVAVKVYALDGASLPLPEQTLRPFQNVTLRLGELIAVSGPPGKFKEGSVELSFRHDNMMAVGPQLTVVDSKARMSFDMEPPMGQQTNRLDGLWWSTDDKTGAQIMLSNTKDLPLSVQMSIDQDGRLVAASVISLGAHQTTVIEVDKLLNSANLGAKGIGLGGVTLTHSGSPGALAAHGFVVNKQQGFASNLYFVDPRSQKTKFLDGAGLLIARPADPSAFAPNSFFRPVLALRNTSDTTQTAKVSVQYTVAGKFEVTTLPVVTLPPHDIRAVDFSPALAALGNKLVADAGIRVESSGESGTLIGQLTSLNQQGRCVDVPLLSVRQNASRSGAHPFSFDGDFHSVLHLKNVGTKLTTAIVKVLYEGGDYAPDLVKILPGQSVALDVQSYRDSQRPDIHGHAFPSGLVSGQVTWSQHGDQTIIGRLVRLSPSGAVAANFSCGGPCSCGAVFDYAVFTPSEIVGEAGDHTGPLLVQEYDHYVTCSGLPEEGPFTVDATFSSDNPSVAQVDEFGSDIVQGEPGDTNIWAKFGVVDHNEVSMECFESCETSCNPVMAPSSLPLPVKTVRVRILKEDGANIACPPQNCVPQNVIVGQKISLYLDVSNNASPLSNVAWGVPPTRFVNYQVNFVNENSSTSAQVTPLENNHDTSIFFYWTDGDFNGLSKQVTLTCKIGPRTFNKTALFRVFKPLVTITISTGTISLDTDYESTGLYFHYGKPTIPGPGTPGMLFQYSNLFLPAGFSPGHTEWVQTASLFRRRKLNGDGWERLQATGLDRRYPFTPLDPDFTLAEDSPGQELFSGYEQQTVSDTFSMYLMFKPSGNDTIWVPLKKINWFWQGSMTRSGIPFLNNWSIVPGSVSRTDNPFAVDEAQPPEWSVNTFGVLYVRE